jgi:hypothetical protein
VSAYPVSKLDVVQNHIEAAVKLIAIESNVFSTHVLAKACEALIIGIAKERKMFIDHDLTIYVKSNYLKQYYRIVNAPYNFFKHADRDAADAYDGPSQSELSQLNELITLMNIRGFIKLGGAMTNEMGAFIAFVMLVHPKVFKIDEVFVDAPELRMQFDFIDKNKPDALVALRHALRQLGKIPYP